MRVLPVVRRAWCGGLTVSKPSATVRHRNKTLRPLRVTLFELQWAVAGRRVTLVTCSRPVLPVKIVVCRGA
jgi:hypothetical protein